MRPKVTEDFELVPVSGTHTGASWLNQSDCGNLQNLSYLMSVCLLKSDSWRFFTFHRSSEKPLVCLCCSTGKLAENREAPVTTVVNQTLSYT